MRETTEISTLRGQLADLKAEADALNERYATAYAQVVAGASDLEIDQAARALIADPKTATLVRDPESELRVTEQALKVNRHAQAILSKSLGLLELRDGYKAALPAFQKAIAHAPRLAAALAALEAEQAATIKDLRAFDAVAGQVAGLSALHPDEKPDYAEWQLEPLKTWAYELSGDGVNKSKLDLWREECAELGLSLKA